MSTPWPTSIAIRRFQLNLNELRARSVSLFTRRSQSVTLSAGTADRWEGVIETPTLLLADMQKMFTFLVNVGIYNDFTIGDPDYAGPVSGATTGSVNGAGQSGSTLIVDGVAASVTTLRAGEYFQIGTEFKMALSDCVANGSGQVSLVFKPPLRTSPLDNATVTFNTPVLLAKLTTIPSKQTDDMKTGAFTVSFEESL